MNPLRQSQAFRLCTLATVLALLVSAVPLAESRGGVPALAASHIFFVSRAITLGLTNVGQRASPTFVDIDNDGDLDAFIGNYDGNTLYFQNMGSAASPIFAAPVTNPFSLAAVEYNATPAFADIDDDGDQDAFIGEAYGNTVYFRNTGDAAHPTFAAPVIDPFGLADVGTYAAPTFADIDNNGVLDAFIGGDDGNTHYFQNIGSATSPVFTSTVANPLGSVDVGSRAAPTLADIDNNGVLDAFIGGDDGNTHYFQNIGSATSPVFTSTVANPFGLAPVGYNAAPAFADIDGDGDQDAFLGDGYGNTVYLRNKGSAADAVFTTPFNPFDLADVGAYAKPTLADINADGDLDAFIGGGDGNTHYFQNIGSAASPVFTSAVANPFGLTGVSGRAAPTLADINDDDDLDAFIGELYGNTLYFRNTGNAANPAFTAPITNYFGLADVGDDWAFPALVDIDGDGHLDTFIGNNMGDIYYFENTGSETSPVFAAPVTNPFGLANVGSRAAPTFADIDGDGDMDAFIGDYFGNTTYFQNTGSATSPAFAAPVVNPFGLAGVGGSAAPALADLDGDGDLDAFIGSGDGNIVYFENVPELASPQTVVLGNGVVIADGDTTPSLDDHTDFGGTTTGITRTFTISNSSSMSSLTIYNLRSSGTGAGDFTLSGLTTPVTLPANTTRTFQVRFAPSLLATSVATVTITSDDGPANDYDFAIQGTGMCANHSSVINANDDGPGTLRRATVLTCDGGTVDFTTNQTIYLFDTLNINKHLTIDGTGRTIKLSGDSFGDGTPNVQVLSLGSSGIVTLTHLTIVSGTASSDVSGYGGGGIRNAGWLTLQDSTLVGNSAANYGGGIYNGGTLTVQNSTFSGNLGDSGGGIYNSNTLTLQNSTLTGNSGDNGGGLYNNNGTLHLLNTLIANSPSGGDCVGSVNTNDHNLIEGNGNACNLSNGAGGSLIGVDPLLGSLANNGGDTPTFALLPSSPALDAGNTATCLATDQRGVARPQGAACDIGAYEFAGLSLTKWVTPSAHVLAHDTVTYTLILGLGQGEVSSDPQIVLTDILPSQVLFNSWVISPANTVQSDNIITWTGALTAGQAITFTFSATYLGSSSQWVTNTAAFSGTIWTGNAAAGFQVGHLITPTAGTGGHITPNTPQIIDQGESITFTIAPDYGYHLIDVGVDGVSVGAVNVYTFTNVTADHTLSATFALNEYTLAVGTNGQGQVTRAPDRTTYPHGSVVTLTATPAQGWYFGQWLGDASGTLTQTTVLMDADKIVTATFVNTPQIYYTLTLSLIGSGFITPTAGAHTYLSGTIVPLSASPDVGWKFIGWSGAVDCADGAVMMTANKLCTATFARYQLYLPLILK